MKIKLNRYVFENLPISVNMRNIRDFVLLVVYVDAACNYTHCIDNTQSPWENVISCGIVSYRHRNNSFSKIERGAFIF